jgi:hypothetical protein
VGHAAQRSWTLNRGPAIASLRPGLLALAAVVLGLAAHGEAGGATTVSTTTLLVGLGVVLATARLATAPPRPLRTAGVLAAGQLAMHLAQGHGLAASAPDHTMPGMHGMTATPGSPVADLTMIGAHLAVAAVVAAGIVHADRGLARAGRQVTARVVAVLARLVRVPELPAPAPASPRPEAPPTTVPVTSRLTRIHPRRGPPSGLPTPTTIPLANGRTSPCTTPGRRAPSPV